MKSKILVLTAFLQIAAILPMQAYAEETTETIVTESTASDTMEFSETTEPTEAETSKITESTEPTEAETSKITESTDPTETETSKITESTDPTETETTKITESTEAETSNITEATEPTEETTETTEPTPEQLAADFVTRMYSIVLDRTPDSAGLESWTQRLLNGEYTAAEAISTMLKSEEYRNKNVSDAAFLSMLCRMMLDREPDAEELAGWTADAKLFSRTYFVQKMAERTEFSDLCTKYGISAGTVASAENRDKNEGLTRYFAMLSQECSGKIPSADVLNTLTGDVLAGTITLNQSIWDFVSASAMERDASYVSALYSGLMGVMPDTAMIQTKTAEMEKGATRFHVFLSMMQTSEFRQVCENYGISAYTEDISDIASAMSANIKTLVYKTAGTSGGDLGYVYSGQILNVTGFNKNWVQVDFMKSTGYLRRDQVAPYAGEGIRVLPVVNIPQCSTLDGASLPTGCEVTSLAVLMHHLGFTDATKNFLANHYMPRGAIGSTDPNYAFMGDPTTSWSYGAYAGPIITTAQRYFSAKGVSDYTVNNLTGAGMEELYAQVDAGNPVLVWYTMNCTSTRAYGATWTLQRGTATTEPGTGTYSFTWKKSEHCSVLVGYNRNKGTVILADVWANSGAVTGALTEYSVSAFESAYNWIGKQAVTITKNAAPSYDMTPEEYLFPVKWYIEQTNQIQYHNGVLYMEDWQSVAGNAILVVTDGTQPVLMDGITGYAAWNEAAVTGMEIAAPENTYLLYTDAVGEELAFLARKYALANAFVQEIHLCELQSCRPAVWDGTLNVFTPEDVNVLDASAFIELSELNGTFTMGETEYGVRSWHFTAVEGALSNLTEAERYAYLKDVEAALNTNYPETIYLANANFTLAEEDMLTKCTASSAWEHCGDFDGNAALDSNDAAAMLLYAAQQGVQADTVLTAAQKAYGDLNCDDLVDAADAAFVLVYSAEAGAGGTPDWLSILR